jgi:UTP-glucose-1-phosphate uridylyltransferase
MHAVFAGASRPVGLDLPMERSALLHEAEQGGFWSYAAGVAYQVMTHYRVRGLEIDNHLTDLPVRKGLSSSAAVCVLVARAFNRIYDLKMTVRGEMELAYLGETTTPSRCGRMDQGCAYGDRPIMMVFDGDRMDVVELVPKRDLHFVIVDLGAGKDTREILNQLNHCYPFAEGRIQTEVQKYLGPISAAITMEARAAIEEGDARRVGELMTRAQIEFDRHLQPACPSQLTAPVLHRVLTHHAVQPYIYGGKGVGSQGDGTAQFVARDEASQTALVSVIERELGMHCLTLTLRSRARVRKALIPAAGFGTRLFPATKAIKKELFPILDREGRAKPVILAIVEEALSAGIEDVAIVVQGQDRELFEDFFGRPPTIENYNKLSGENQRYNSYLMEVGRKVTFLVQDAQEGFGHAVYCAREWAGREPFLLLLGDHIYTSTTGETCARQMVRTYERLGRSVVGLKPVTGGEAHSFGCVGGTWLERDTLLSIGEFVEKPDADYAAANLRVDGMEPDTYLSLFGIYVLKPTVFDFLEENIRHNVRERGEFQLTSCLERVRQTEGFAGLVVKGNRFDIGRPGSYRSAMLEFGVQTPAPAV